MQSVTASEDLSCVVNCRDMHQACVFDLQLEKCLSIIVREPVQMRSFVQTPQLLTIHS